MTIVNYNVGMVQQIPSLKNVMMGIDFRSMDVIKIVKINVVMDFYKETNNVILEYQEQLVALSVFSSVEMVTLIMDKFVMTEIVLVEMGAQINVHYSVEMENSVRQNSVMMVIQEAQMDVVHNAKFKMDLVVRLLILHVQVQLLVEMDNLTQENNVMMGIMLMEMDATQPV